MANLAFVETGLGHNGGEISRFAIFREHPIIFFIIAKNCIYIVWTKYAFIVKMMVRRLREHRAAISMTDI